MEELSLDMAEEALFPDGDFARLERKKPAAVFKRRGKAKDGGAADEGKRKTTHTKSWIDRCLSSRFLRVPEFFHGSQRRVVPSKPPATFVREKQAHFAEVDAFELQEESPSPKTFTRRSIFEGSTCFLPARDGHLEAVPEEIFASPEDLLSAALRTPPVRGVLRPRPMDALISDLECLSISKPVAELPTMSMIDILLHESDQESIVSLSQGFSEFWWVFSNLVRAWKKWDTQHNSENDQPLAFPEEQLYVVFVLADGGTDLESFELLNYEEVKSLLLQVVLSLAVAEQAYGFEHRDLHWGNIVLSRDQHEQLDFRLENRHFLVNTHGLSVALIDFTLSRIDTGKQVVFCDLSDPSWFEGPKGDVQADTYRRMKDITGGQWEGSFPKNNSVWIHYVAEIIRKKKSFKSSAKDKRALSAFSKRCLSYESATAIVDDEIFQKMWRKEIYSSQHEEHANREESVNLPG
ncbi:uncharacterized protein LOC9657580 [Selaginella moellendorffii]|uniref:uncharacterized protein LOC9657580 n=1 Tax=Selaginella moellendorffii TaxID=88036 RepID=UPI000D1CD4D3|nr:uncharacterized protein LOC9657580 [Selaginella moellendorffii]|eukprot:XP_024538404.1 uncharacterized protein LOC9657580 [Selaginella moellendorffii]